MKRIFLLVLTTIMSVVATAQQIKPAPNDKTVVYFVRTSGFGPLANFSYFDSTVAIAITKGTNYFRYECRPGTHIFWAKAENIDFVEADLEPGKIYFIEAEPKMGITKAEVDLRPVDPSDEKTMTSIFKLMNKKSEADVATEKLQREIQRTQRVAKESLEIYYKDKENGKKTDRLEKHKYYPFKN